MNKQVKILWAVLAILVVFQIWGLASNSDGVYTKSLTENDVIHIIHQVLQHGEADANFNKIYAKKIESDLYHLTGNSVNVPAGIWGKNKTDHSPTFAMFSVDERKRMAFEVGDKITNIVIRGRNEDPVIMLYTTEKYAQIMTGSNSDVANSSYSALASQSTGWSALEVSHNGRKHLFPR